MSRLKKLARPRWILVFLAVFISCQIVFLFLFPALATRGVPTTLDMMTGFNPDQARLHFSLYTDKSSALLNWFQAVDVVFPISYGLLFSSFSAWLLGKLRPGANHLLLLCAIPLAAALFDLLENTGIFIMARIYPASIEVSAQLTSLAGVVKNILFLGSILLCLVLGIAAWVKCCGDRKKSKNDKQG
jgi:hypothetical protein